jgi:hypothetical protein
MANDESRAKMPASGTVVDPVRPKQERGKHMTVKQGTVGAYPEGSRVPVSVLGDEANIERLKGLGVIADEDAEDLPKRPTLAEAIRSDSPPTLPRAPYIDATPEEIRAAVDPSNTFVTGPLPDEPRIPESAGQAPEIGPEPTPEQRRAQRIAAFATPEEAEEQRAAEAGEPANEQRVSRRGRGRE